MSRLIDADALWMDVIHNMDYCDDILEIIERQPAIEERKMGEWSRAERQKSEVFYCSVCGGRAYHPWFGSRKSNEKNVCHYKYCPNCGANMKEG